MPKPANRLLVEGMDDIYVIGELLEYNAIPETFRLIEKSGFERLLEDIEVEIEGSGVTRLGVVVDADWDAMHRWTQLQGKLRTCGYTTVPQEPDGDGTIIQQPGRPTFGIWIMPDNRIPGSIEDFVRMLVREDDAALWQRAENVVQKLPKKMIRFRPTYASKAKIHTFLAWQEEPGSPMGLAIKKRYLQPDAPQANAFIAWVHRLFIEPDSEAS
jgi:hypothetical protein